MKLSRLFFLNFCIILLFASCQKTPEVPYIAPVIEKKYIFLGHTYDWAYYAQGNKVDPRLEQFDFSPYHQIWLGGDICTETTKEPQTMSYLNNLFSIASSNTHWALGNHDVRQRNVQYITDFTKRPTFYATYVDGMCLVVLNTNLNHPQAKVPEGEDECDLQNQQYAMLETISDTITKASHLVVLHHHSLVSDYIEDINQSDPNSYLPELPFACEPTGRFHELVYPKMQAVQERNIQVVFISGDFGTRAKEYEYQTADGIYFLGSGINNTYPLTTIDEDSFVIAFGPDKVLELHRNIETKTFSWQFLDLDSLLATQ
ncbi:MAG: hypothetical protein ACPG5B_09580 [Chitinophagales bacterium]